MLHKMLIILEADCGTEKVLHIHAVVEGGDVVSPLSERTLGRVTAEDVITSNIG